MHKKLSARGEKNIYGVTPHTVYLIVGAFFPPFCLCGIFPWLMADIFYLFVILCVSYQCVTPPWITSCVSFCCLQGSAADLVSVWNSVLILLCSVFLSLQNKSSKWRLLFSQVVRDYNLQLFLQENSVFHKPQPFQFQPSDSDTVRTPLNSFISFFLLYF